MNPSPSSAPADIAMTLKGEAYCRAHAEAVDRQNRLTIEGEIKKLLDIRKQAGDLAEHLISMLDEIDGDFDLEDGADDEPSTCASAAIGRGHGDDLEEDTADAEPSLGWTSALNQTGRARLAGYDDREDEHDGREPDVDDEDGGDQEETWIREAPRLRPDTRAFPYRIGGITVVGEVTS